MGVGSISRLLMAVSRAVCGKWPAAFRGAQHAPLPDSALLCDQSICSGCIGGL